jgi:multimeric flavodoxin WrbA
MLFIFSENVYRKSFKIKIIKTRGRKRMKVIAVNSSPNLNGNTFQSLEKVCKVLKTKNIETDIIQLRKMDLNPCLACYKCMGKGRCVQNDDINPLLKKLLEADGIILGSPTYFSNVTSRMQMFIERIGLISKLNGSLLKNKIGASVAVARRMGANVVYSAMNYFFGILEMPIASSIYWNVIVGLQPGDINKDAEGMQILQKLGENMLNMLLKMHKT